MTEARPLTPVRIGELKRRCVRSWVLPHMVAEAAEASAVMEDLTITRTLFQQRRAEWWCMSA